ncbi:MAG TPA: hypothetical protein VFN25_03630 [Dokdonella sp.]|uniref:hypothetical protein n=1 Tax=Dokdonella sp. TaxID=2291710 RepID=UPI002D7F9094|nr:hypothetical protein [Dokdonella sp.]HET9031977.1 hypothetical protein [Dokdonella sp.]
MTNLRWVGEVNGRSCEVKITVQGRTRHSGAVRSREQLGYRLRIELSTPLSVGLFFVREGFAQSRLAQWIYRLRKQDVIRHVPASLNGFCVVTNDIEYAQRLIQQPLAMQEVGDLLNRKRSATLAGSVYFGPGAIYYASPIVQADDLTPECVLDINEKLRSIVTDAEVLPPPQVPCSPTALGTLSKSHPILSVILIMGLVLGAMLISAGLLFALAILLGTIF